MTTNQRPNPYVGPRAFRQGETLYGRDHEVQELLDLLIAERIVLLHSPSGAGKSSLINAALIPRLQGEDFRVRPPVRVNTEVPGELIAQNGHVNRFVLSALLSLEEGLPREQQRPIAELAQLSLDEYLRPQPVVNAVQPEPEISRRAATRHDAARQAEVLIFDQFEEIITIDPANTAVRVEFFKQLGEALRDRGRWAVLAMREDFIGTLDPYTRYLPTRLHNTFRLDLLGPAAAQEAMQKPAGHRGVEFTAEAAHKLVDDLRRVRVQRPDGTFAEQLGPYIEPVQLQVVCYRLWEQLPTDAMAIQAADIASAGDVDTVLANYYADSVSATTQATGVSERAIRDWFEEELITAQGVRGQVLRGGEQGQQITDQAIRQLIDAHIVRAEERRGATWFELAHDRLIEPVRKSNAAWRAATLSPVQRQAELWDQQNRAEGLLLRSTTLTDAEQWVNDHASELTPVEQDFLAACRKARAAEQRERRNNRLIRGLAVAALVALVVAIAGVIFASQQTQIAEIQARLARARELAASSISILDVDPELSLLLATEAINTTYKVDATFVTAASIALDKALASPFRATLRGHTGWVEQADFSPDGMRIVTASDDKTARLWNASDGKLIAVLSGHAQELTTASFSPDGTRIVTAGFDGAAILWDASTGTLLARLNGHSNVIYTAAFSPDGTRVVTASFDRTARLWNARDGALIAILNGHTDALNSADFSPDGKYIITASRDGTARLWDGLNGSFIRSFNGHTVRLWGARFSPDGTRLLTASYDQTVRLWNVSDGTLIATLAGHTGVVIEAIFSPDGTRIVTASWDGTARLWNAQNQALIATLIGHSDRVNAASFDSTGKYIITASSDGTARLWDGTDGRPITTFSGHTGPVMSARFSPKGDRIVTAALDNTARVWNVRNEMLTFVLKEHPPFILSSDFSANGVFSPDGTRLVTSGYDDKARLWNTQDGNLIATLSGHSNQVTSASFSPDGKYIVTASWDGTARLWDGRSGALVTVIAPSPSLDLIAFASFSPDGTLIALAGETVGRDSSALVWDVERGTPVARLQGHTNGIVFVSFSPDGKRVVTTSYDNTARLWNVQDGTPIATLAHADWVKSASFSPNGKYIVTASYDKTARLWNGQNGALIATLANHTDAVNTASFSPDGKWIVTASRDGTVRVWDGQKGDLIMTLTGHIGWVNMASFSPDGKRLLSAGDDNTARLWDAQTGIPLTTLIGHTGDVTSARFSPDGTQIATASEDGTVGLWRFPNRDVVARLAEAAQRVSRTLTEAECRQYLAQEVCPVSP